MTPEEFDEVYYALAQSLKAVEDPTLYRDRLLLLLLQELDADRALAVIGSARLATPVAELKDPPSAEASIVRMAHI